MQFFETMMGRTFYESHVPQVVRTVKDLVVSLKDIAQELKRANDLREKELLKK